MSVPAYEHYRESGVDWLGEVPSHWGVRRLKHVAEVFPSNVDKKSQEGEVAVRLCNYTDVYYNDVIVDDPDFMVATATKDQIDKFTLRAGDTIITKDSETADDIAISALVPRDLPGIVCGYHLSMVRPVSGTSGAFIKRFFDSAFAKASFAVRANGLTRVGLGQYAVDNVEVPCPPFPEQTAIAAFLDRETAKIDALVEEQRRLIDLLREKRQAVISHAVAKGLDPTVPTKDSGVEWLGEVPAHWEVGPLKFITASYCDGPFGSGLKSDHYSEAGVRVIRLQNIKSGRFDGNDAAFIDEAYFRESLIHHEVLAGDVLVAGLGDDRNLVGRACVAPNDIGLALVKADCFRFRLRSGNCSDFVAAQLSAGAGFAAGTLSSGSTRSRIPASTMAQRRIAMPPLGEQISIAKWLAERAEDFESLTSTAEAVIKLLKERRAALISAAVTGKIDVRGLVSKETKAA